ncbi:MAG: hypothetical protein FWD55_06660 [Propionibacteriaceae bacterium]|nr:hypothetical protein [Propionibacteriaceae bacterium]
MKALSVGILGILVVIGVSGCTADPGVDPTVPPIPPTHQIVGSVLPEAVAGYTVLGEIPAPGQMTATYGRDAAPLDLAVVTFDPTGEFGQTTLTDQAWYGVTRCGILWKGDSQATPQPTQAACITVLTDGVMTVVSGGEQTPADLSILANAIHDQLA